MKTTASTSARRASGSKGGRGRRGWAGWEANRGERRAVTIGLVVTAGVHGVLFLILPWLPPMAKPGGGEGVGAVTRSGQNFEVRMMPDGTEEEAALSMPRFVEVNPDAPDNVPDRTDNVGAQNQQVAQEEPTPGGDSDTPVVSGETEPEGTAIVSGTLDPVALPPVLAVPARPVPAEEVAAADEAAREAARLGLEALPGFEDMTGDSETGVGSAGGQTPGTARETVEGAADGSPEGWVVRGRRGGIDRNNPQPRPRLGTEQLAPARSAPLRENDFGTQNVGAVAFDARWSDYGEYLQRLIESVQGQWERIIRNSAVYPDAGARVTVRFILNAKGEVEELVEVSGTGGRVASYACVSAITERAPYGPWTEDMVAVFGESQELTFRFFYQ